MPSENDTTFVRCGEPREAWIPLFGAVSARYWFRPLPSAGMSPGSGEEQVGG
jgi:hypothetical protein